ncbi:hypothetical protein SAMN05446935_4892 [Burkholderia sp. YR290]|nr:hypothetical protein SAMN05446935_4892 [Burkholderia sp. YR290]
MTTIPNERGRTMTAAQKQPALGNESRAYDAAVEFRDRLLANNWSDDTTMAERLEARLRGDARHALAGMRRGGMLLGVWSASRGCFLYPDFQFDGDGRLIPEISLLLRILPAEDDDSGWRRAFWLYSPHALLDGSTPSAIFALDPLRILEIADAEFNTSSDSGW